MLEGMFSEKEIKEKLSELKEIDKDMYEYLLNKKIEFNKFKIFKKTIEQTIKRYLLRVAGFEKVAIKEYPSKFIEEYQKRLTVKELIDKINRPHHKKIILYVASAPTFNIIRQSIYLRKSGYETILLMEKSLSLVNLAEKYFDIVYVFNSIYSLSYILKEARPYLVHVQGTPRNANHFGILAKLLSSSKVVFNFYDIPSTTIAKGEDIVSACKELVDAGDTGGSAEELKLDLFSERFACERCDGIIYSYAPRVEEILKNRYRISSPMLEFHSYTCDEFMRNNSRKYSDEDGKIHLVYGGNVAQSHLPKKFFGDCQFHSVIDKITRQGVHFDIFVMDASLKRIKQTYADYLLMSEQNPFFNLKQGMILESATREFSKYDFGAMIYPFGKEILIKDTEHAQMRLPDKFFTYTEAGLPILISEESQCGANLVKKYEMGIVVSQKDLYNLPEIINSYDREKLMANVKKAREELSMKRQIGRLIDFYEKVYNNS